MPKELLEQIKKAVKIEQERRQEENERIQRITKLESIPEIKEYLVLRGLAETQLKLLNLADKSIYLNAFDNVSQRLKLIENIGIYKLSYEGWYLKNFKKKKYRVYLDIVTLEEYIITDSHFDEFESKHIILNDDIDLSEALAYFIKQSIEVGEEEAYKVIKKTYANGSNK